LASIKEARFPLSIPAGLDERIAMYRQYTLAAFCFRDQHPDRYYRLSYERLVGEPEATVRDLMAWLGEAFDERQLAFNARGVDHAAGLEDPKIARTDRIHSDSVGRWRTLLDPVEAETIWCNTRDLVEPHTSNEFRLDVDATATYQNAEGMADRLDAGRAVGTLLGSNA
jgi:hypothetical protein